MLANRNRLLIAGGVTLVLIAGVLNFALRATKENIVKTSLRMASGFTTSVTLLDPATIETAFDYDLAQNLYGRLLRYDETNQLVADIPKSFSWTESEVRFEFSNRAITASGHVINALDAEASLKRLIMKGGSGHGDIRKFLCPQHELRSLDDNCPGIRVEGNVLILRAVKSSYLSMLMNSLQNADYSILPLTVIDRQSGDLVDKRHYETSGPYFASTDSATGHIILSANKSHYLFAPDLVQTVELIPPAEGDPIDGFKSGKIDYVPTSVYFSGDAVAGLIADHANEVYETLPTSLTLMRFSRAGLSRFTPA